MILNNPNKQGKKRESEASRYLQGAGGIILCIVLTLLFIGRKDGADGDEKRRIGFGQDSTIVTGISSDSAFMVSLPGSESSEAITITGYRFPKRDGSECHSESKAAQELAKYIDQHFAQTQRPVTLHKPDFKENGRIKESYDIFFSGESLGRLLTKNRLAWPVEGRAANPWCKKKA